MKNFAKSIAIVLMVSLAAACSNGAQITAAKEKAQSDASTAGSAALYPAQPSPPGPA